MNNSDANIQINPNKSTELEFDVIIQGIEDANLPIVRFVIVSAIDDCDYSFKCSKVEGEKSKWLARMPAFPQFKVNTSKFRVEVIVDEYFFVPAEGEITFITAPEVKFKSKNTPKPTVTTSFTVKQSEDDEKSEKKDGSGKLFTDAEVRARGKEELEKQKKKVTEDLLETPQGGGGGEVTGRYAPTNALLKPEADPTENGRMRGDTSVNDEFTDEDRLSLDKVEDIASAIRPGEGRAYQQEDGKDREGKIAAEEEEFDPKKVADNIMKSALGNLPKSTTKGTLFKRDSSGKTVIKGLEDTKTKEKLKGNAKKVSDILKST
jgi:hypothetical protein